LLESN